MHSHLNAVCRVLTKCSCQCLIKDICDSVVVYGVQKGCSDADQAVLAKPIAAAQAVRFMYQKLWTSTSTTCNDYQKFINNMNSRIRQGKLDGSDGAYKQGSANFHYAVRQEELNDEVCKFNQCFVTAAM